MKIDAQLCPVVEGVMFTTSYRGRCVRGLILRDALEQRFGAGENPQSWLHAFQENREAIAERAWDLWAETPDQRMVLLRWQHFDVDGGPPAESTQCLREHRPR